jgi:hypothetical protein
MFDNLHMEASKAITVLNFDLYMHECATGGPYEVFAGRDASRGLATMSMTVSDHYDDLSDLTDAQRASLFHWEKQFSGLPL